MIKESFNTVPDYHEFEIDKKIHPNHLVLNIPNYRIKSFDFAMLELEQIKILDDGLFNLELQLIFSFDIFDLLSLSSELLV